MNFGLARVHTRAFDLPDQGLGISVEQPFKPSIDGIDQSNWRSFGQAPIKGCDPKWQAEMKRGRLR